MSSVCQHCVPDSSPLWVYIAIVVSQTLIWVSPVSAQENLLSPSFSRVGGLCSSSEGLWTRIVWGGRSLLDLASNWLFILCFQKLKIDPPTRSTNNNKSVFEKNSSHCFSCWLWHLGIKRQQKIEYTISAFQTCSLPREWSLTLWGEALFHVFLMRKFFLRLLAT